MAEFHQPVPEPIVRYVDRELEDPAGRSPEMVRPIRDEVERLVRALVVELVGQDP
jgi:hypothetical protein